MSSCALFLDAPETVAKTQQQIQNPVKKTGLPLLVGTGVDTALETLKTQDVAGARPALVLLGPHLENPVAIGRRLHREAPLAHLAFLAYGRKTTLVQQLKSPLAMVGNYWSVIDLTSDNLTALLQDAAGSAQQRLQLRTTLNHINVQLSSHPPADFSELQRYTVSDRFLANILEHAHDAIIATDNEGIIITWNKAAQNMFGLSQDNAVGRPIDEVAGGDWPEQLPGLLAQIHASGSAYSRQELVCRRSDGQTLTVELMLSLVRQQSGKPMGVSAIVRDITERKQLEDALHKTNLELERRVEQRTQELTEANEKLERSNIELTRFAYIASHDLQSPLRSISGFLQLLQEDYQGQLDEQADHWINRVVENTSRMKTLINDLLSYSRIDSRARPFTHLAFRRVFDDAVNSLQASIQDANAEITCGNLPSVSGDRPQLVQLMQNLIENAIKYNESPRPQVHVSAQKEGNEWVFSIRDNGIGIEAKHGQKIFEIFNRLHSQQTYPGTGIGLAVCRRIVHRHGGRIWVESQPGKGSTFYFTIPERTITHER